MSAEDLAIFGAACHYAPSVERVASLALNHAPLLTRAKDLIRQGVSRESVEAIAVSLLQREIA
jgi:hypothetical protein